MTNSLNWATKIIKVKEVTSQDSNLSPQMSSKSVHKIIFCFFSAGVTFVRLE